MKSKVIGVALLSVLFASSASAQVTSSVMSAEVVIPSDCYYMQVHNPVCGSDGHTYMNAGQAYCASVMRYFPGSCAGDTPVVTGGVTTEELIFASEPLAQTDYFGDVDTDQDGLTDLVEENLGTDPTNVDSDADGVWDAAEVSMGLSPLNDDLIFTDFDDVDWARDYIVEMVSRGGVKGFEDGSFRPSEDVTRAELLKIMIDSLHYQLAAVDELNIFSDVSSDSWQARYTSFAKGAGVISGYANGDFKPNDPITRAEAIKVMTRLVGFPLDVEIDPHFTDLSGWQIPYVENARRKGIVSASDDRLFRPDDFITRAEVVKIATNYLKGRY